MACQFFFEEVVICFALIGGCQAFLPLFMVAV